MIQFIKTDSKNIDFQKLVLELDKDLKIRDGEEHEFYAQFNKIDQIDHVIVAYENQQAVGCGAIKPYEKGIMEVKRMFVAINFRGRNIATKILINLENWSKELGSAKCILETGKRQPEAIALYLKNKYKITPNYGQYQHAENSVCFEKKL